MKTTNEIPVEACREVQRYEEELLASFSHLIDDPRECSLCGCPEYKKATSGTVVEFRRFQTPCPRSGCDGEFEFIALEFDVNDIIGGTRWCEATCSEDEHEYDTRDIYVAIEDEDPVEAFEWRIPFERVERNMFHEHHTSYSPERTITSTRETRDRARQRMDQIEEDLDVLREAGQEDLVEEFVNRFGRVERLEREVEELRAKLDENEQ